MPKEITEEEFLKCQKDEENQRKLDNWLIYNQRAEHEPKMRKVVKRLVTRNHYKHSVLNGMIRAEQKSI